MLHRRNLGALAHQESEEPPHTFVMQEFEHHNHHQVDVWQTFDMMLH